MKVTKNLKRTISYIVVIAMVLSGMTQYSTKNTYAGSVSWKCMNGSYWTGYSTYQTHSSKADKRAKNAVAYYVAEKSSDDLTDVVLTATSDLNITMENGEGTTPFIAANDSIKFYIADGMVKADEFSEDDLAKTTAATANASNKVEYKNSQNDAKKIITNAYSSMKVVNGDKYVVIWFRSAMPENYYSSITDWTKVCSYNGKDIYYHLSINGNEGFSEITYDDNGINIVSNSNAKKYRSGRFYTSDGINETLVSSNYSKCTYSLTYDKLTSENASLFLATQGTTSYGYGIDFKVVSEQAETTPEETTLEETTPEETTPEVTTLEIPTADETTTIGDETYTFEDNGTETGLYYDSVKDADEQLPKTLKLKAKNSLGEKVAEVDVTKWNIDTENIIVGRYVTPEAVFSYEGKEYTYKLNPLVVSSSQLVYFVDCNSGSTVEFPTIAASKELINGTTADQQFDATVDKTWGYVNKGNTKKLDKYSNGLYNTGYYAASNNGKITYKFWLTEGTYKFTSGHCEWWGGGNSRHIKVEASYEDKQGTQHTELLGISQGNTTKGEQPAVVNNFTVRNVEEGTYVTITFSRHSGVAPAVAYMAFEKLSVMVPNAPAGLQYLGNTQLPFYFAWAKDDNAESYNVYLNGTFVGSTTDTAYNFDPKLFEEEGEYTIEVSAVNSSGESEKAQVKYEVKTETTTEETTTEETTTPETTTEETTTPEVTTPEITTPESTTPSVTTGNDSHRKHDSVVKVGNSKIVKTYSKNIKSKKIRLTIKRVKGAKGYQVQIVKDKKCKKKELTRKVKNTKITITSKLLKNKKKLYVRVRAYTLVKGKMITGKWTKPKKIRINK